MSTRIGSATALPGLTLDDKELMMRPSLVFAAGLIALVGAAPAATAARISQQATTRSYSFTLDVGAMEAMYTPAQAKQKHPSSGEVMVGGGMMSSSMASSMGGAVERHLELHVRSRATGTVVTGVMPTIELSDQSSNAMPVKVEVVAMEGIGQGTADLHYGNNVSLEMGHTYVVKVAVHGETASFTFKAS